MSFYKHWTFYSLMTTFGVLNVVCGSCKFIEANMRSKSISFSYYGGILLQIFLGFLSIDLYFINQIEN